MDQKTSNDADKRNWRERLGIGTKDMPRISDEFAKPKEPVLVAEQPKPKAAQGQPIVVAKPAPMAPRVAPKPAERPAPQPVPSTATSGRPMQPSAPQSPDVLAERLRNQRVAAEKLAEQRVSAAKERAEANRAQAASAPPVQAPVQQTRPTGGPPPRGKPKFTFSEDELKAEPKRDSSRPAPQMRPTIPPPRPAQQQAMQPQLSPPRPTLGGDRPMLPQGAPQGPQAAPPPAGGFPPQFRPASYRPIDPATGYVPPSSSFQPNRMPPGQGPRPPADPRARPRLGGEGYVPDPLNEPSLRMPRYEPLAKPAVRQEPLRQQNYNFDTDYNDEIFEEPASPPPRRASATDYNQAYRDQDAMFEPERRRRSGGPWMLLALLLLAAAAAGGGIWFYQTNIKTASNGGETPVVPSPDTPAKTQQPAANADAPAPSPTVQAPSKKQIYDRIIGDKEVPAGQMAPTEEAPVQPPVQGSAQPSNVPQPDGVPAPAAGSGEEALPLPMPPPPGSNTQGAAQPAGTTQMASNGSQTPNAAAIPQPAAVTNQTMIQEPAAAPAPQPAATPTEQAAATQPAQQITEPQPADQETISEQPAPAPKKKSVKTAQTTKAKTKPKQLGAKPVVLVPPPEEASAATQDPALAAEGEPPLQAGATPEPAPAPAKKKKTLLGLFTGENNKVDETAPAETQVASVQQPQAPQQPQQPAASQAASGFVVQLTSYRSEDEARTEARRVASKHAGILNGMTPSVMKVSAGGSTRYRVAFGTVTSRNQASTVCQQLASAGERDCIIGRR